MEIMVPYKLWLEILETLDFYADKDNYSSLEDLGKKAREFLEELEKKARE